MKDFKIGPVVRSNVGFHGPLRSNEDSALVNCDGHSRWYELASRGQLFSATTAYTGTTVVAGNCCDETPGAERGPAAGAATLLSILNPVGSGVNLEILQGWICDVSASGGPFPGVWFWCGQLPGVRITANEATAIKGTQLVGQAITRARAYSQVALTGGIVHKLIKPFRKSLDNNGFFAPDQYIVTDNVDGCLVVPEGGVMTLAPGNQNPGTNWRLALSMMYAEIPVPA